MGAVSGGSWASPRAFWACTAEPEAGLDRRAFDWRTSGVRLYYDSWCDWCSQLSLSLSLSLYIYIVDIYIYIYIVGCISHIMIISHWAAMRAAVRSAGGRFSRAGPGGPVARPDFFCFQRWLVEGLPPAGRDVSAAAAALAEPESSWWCSLLGWASVRDLWPWLRSVSTSAGSRAGRRRITGRPAAAPGQALVAGPLPRCCAGPSRIERLPCSSVNSKRIDSVKLQLKFEFTEVNLKPLFCRRSQRLSKDWVAACQSRDCNWDRMSMTQSPESNWKDSVWGSVAIMTAAEPWTLFGDWVTVPGICGRCVTQAIKIAAMARHWQFWTHKEHIWLVVNDVPKSREYHLAIEPTVFHYRRIKKSPSSA
jgi:hypothetical protein